MEVSENAWDHGRYKLLYHFLITTKRRNVKTLEKQKYSNFPCPSYLTKEVTAQM